MMQTAIAMNSCFQTLRQNVSEIAPFHGRYKHDVYIGTIGTILCGTIE